MTLAFAGLEPDDLTDFRRVFGKLRSQLGADWRLVDSDDADLTVVDIDSIYGHMDWLKLTGSGMRAAVYTSAQYAKESDLVLFKPLKPDNLAEILNAVAAEHGQAVEHTSVPEPAPQDAPAVVAEEASASVETVSAAPEPEVEAAPAPPAASPVAQPAPLDEETAQQQVELARETVAAPATPASAEADLDAEPEENAGSVRDWLLRGYFGEPVRMTAGEDAWIVDPDREAYYGPATLKPLGSILEHPKSDLQPVNVTALEKARKDQAQPLARLRWYAGLTASPGTLTPALQNSTRFGLSRWPQIEREFPRHFRIATAMMKQAGSLAELSAASGAPETEVADFINASHAVGIVEHDGKGSDSQSRSRGIGRFRGR